MLITSNKKIGDLDNYEKLGYSAYLLKPLNKYDLYNCISQIIGNISNGRDDKGRKIITRNSLIDWNKGLELVFL